MNCSPALWSRLHLADVTTVLTPQLTEPTIEAQVDRLLGELPSRFLLAGLSLGGIVAMALVRAAPERVSAMALLSTNPYAPAPRQLADWRACRDALDAGSAARELQRSWLPLLLSAQARARPDIVRTTLRMADEVGETHLDAQLAMQATRIDERPGLVDLRCPLLIVAAAADALCSIERHREMAGLAPNAGLILVDGGHLSPLEQPDAISSHLVRWLRSLAIGG
jgi:pimeloyl-ACP methyl ester carboxylesterase